MVSDKKLQDLNKSEPSVNQFFINIKFKSLKYKI
jgi:hypothetical protein